MNDSHEPRPPRIEDVRRFWNANPLFTGESADEPGTEAFFERHTQASLEMAGGEIPFQLWPAIEPDAPILDLGCGIGFWLEQFWKRGYRNIHGADLSENSLALAARRCDLANANVQLSQQNCENMTYPAETFQHVNCIGVIHHSPNPSASIAEIARVLKPGGTATISVYNWNIALRSWPLIRPVAEFFGRRGVTLTGRGREDMMAFESAREVVRLYDGKDNPIGSAYTRRQFSEMLSGHFEVTQILGYVFPARVLPFALPQPLFRLAERICPFMICGIVRKPALARRECAPIV